MSATNFANITLVSGISELKIDYVQTHKQTDTTEYMISRRSTAEADNYSETEQGTVFLWNAVYDE